MFPFIFTTFTMPLLAVLDLYCIVDIHFQVLSVQVLSFQVVDLVASW